MVRVWDLLGSEHPNTAMVKLATLCCSASRLLSPSCAGRTCRKPEVSLELGGATSWSLARDCLACVHSLAGGRGIEPRLLIAAVVRYGTIAAPFRGASPTAAIAADAAGLLRCCRRTELPKNSSQTEAKRRARS